MIAHEQFMKINKVSFLLKTSMQKMPHIDQVGTIAQRAL
jgi:hypothetical protein